MSASPKLPPSMATTVILLASVILCAMATATAASAVRRGRNLPTVIGQRSRRVNRYTECYFDKHIYEIGATWNPDFGPPKGIDYCVRCQCVEQTKNRRVTANAQCHSIRDQCPAANCKHPITPPGRCCKVCPGQAPGGNNPDMQFDTVQEDELEANETRHYVTLMSGRTSMFLHSDSIKSIYSTRNPQNIVVSGRFTYTAKNLYYSFQVSQKAATKPRIVQFIDRSGRILQEKSLRETVAGPLSRYQNSTGKVCGVWRRMAFEMRQMLRADQIFVVLLWGGPYEDDLAIAGRISSAPFQLEMFSALLELAPGTRPQQMRGSGGTAVVATHSGLTVGLNVSLVFNGLFGARDIANVGINVRLESATGLGVFVNRTFVIAKPEPDYNRLELHANLTTFQLRQLTAGKVVIAVESQRNPNLRLRGKIATRIACEHFQSLLGAGQSGEASGLAWSFIDRNGNLEYSVRTDSVDMETRPSLHLGCATCKRTMIVTDLNENRTAFAGVWDKLGPRFLEILYAGQLHMSVVRHTGQRILDGRLESRQMADARDSAEPVLLLQSDATRSADLIGMVWLAVEDECSLRFEVSLNSSAMRTYQLSMVDVPMEVEGAPLKRRVLGSWRGAHFEGFQMGLSAPDLLRLETHIVHLHVQTRGMPPLRGRLPPLRVPTNCRESEDEKPDQPGQTKKAAPCFESKRFHRDGDQWRSEQKSCTVCSCLRGDVQCEPIRCPPLMCPQAERQTRTGECCASCAITDETLAAVDLAANDTAQSPAAGCWLGSQFHQAGATFHPYLPPNSFDTCAICHCDPISLTISCPRVQCPALQCADSVAQRVDKSACCKQCPDAPIDAELMQDQAPVGDDQEMLVGMEAALSNPVSGGNCIVGSSVFVNGQNWHPRLHSGEKKCVNCRCRDSQTTCEAAFQCTRAVCEDLARMLSGPAADGSGETVTERSCCEDACRRMLTIGDLQEV